MPVRLTEDKKYRTTGKGLGGDRERFEVDSTCKKTFFDQKAKKYLGKQVDFENIPDGVLRIRTCCGLQPQPKEVSWVGTISKASNHQKHASTTPCSEEQSFLGL